MPSVPTCNSSPHHALLIHVQLNQRQVRSFANLGVVLCSLRGLRCRPPPFSRKARQKCSPRPSTFWLGRLMGSLRVRHARFSNVHDPFCGSMRHGRQDDPVLERLAGSRRQCRPLRQQVARCSVQEHPAARSLGERRPDVAPAW